MFHFFWYILSICAMLGFPRHIWIEYDPLRWIVIGAMLADFWWSWPLVVEMFAEIRKDREASP